MIPIQLVILLLSRLNNSLSNLTVIFHNFPEGVIEVAAIILACPLSMVCSVK